MVIDYKNHSEVLNALAAAQDVEDDNRERVREATHFLTARDGQWDPEATEIFNDQPRYTFDKCSPIVDQIVGEIERSDFAMKTRPAGGAASQNTAKLLDGLLRNIESMSKATSLVYNPAAKRATAYGIDGWRITTAWVNDDAFHQDILLKKIANFTDRVWFDPNAEAATMEDAEYCFVLESLDKKTYQERYPEGSGVSISDSRNSTVYFNRKDEVVIGEILYKKYVDRELVLMSDGAVFEADEKFERAAAELQLQGVTEVRRRKRKDTVVYSRLFDGKDFLSKPQETPFSYLPVIPEFANFDVVENKVIYWGAIEKLMDPQRVYNYAKSRQTAEGALAPRGKFFITPEQAAGHQNKLATLNSNADPVQQYNHVDGQPAPYWVNGGTTNPGLQQTAMDAATDINSAAGLFSANLGDNPGLQSGVAVGKIQDKGDNGTYKYFSAHILALQHTATVILSAVPKVYDTQRIVRILGEDGSAEMVTLFEEVKDQATGEAIVLNDLTKGVYDVTVSVAPHFENRQQETVRSITEIATVDPSILEDGADVWLSNINSPGVNLIAERRRHQMVVAGKIPENQLTEDEKQLVQQLSQQKPEPTPVEQALIQQAQAEAADKQAQTAERIAKLEQNQQKLDNDRLKIVNDFKVQQDKLAIDQERLGIELRESISGFEKAMDEQIKMQAETLKVIREAMGADAVVGPQVVESYERQSEILTDSQVESGNVTA